MTDKLPKLPQQISNDGREVWDWAAKVSDTIHRRARISELRQNIAELGSRCGSCRLWMTDECPREQLLPTGRKSGPSMMDAKCQRFAITSNGVSRVETLTAELKQLESKT